MVAPDVVHGCAQVDAAFDALARIDVAALSDDELHGYVGELHRLTSRLASVHVRVALVTSASHSAAIVAPGAALVERIDSSSARGDRKSSRPLEP